MVEQDNQNVSVRKQCDLLGIYRSFLYKDEETRSEKNLKKLERVVKLIKKINGDFPFYGRRKVQKTLGFMSGIWLSEYMVGKIMKDNGIKALMKKRKLTKSKKEHKKYPYLLRGLEIMRANQVWATDITYLNVGGYYIYLMAIIDLFSRKILSWGVSTAQDAGFCMEILIRALNKYGTPEIFNTDQGSQYTSNAFTGILKANKIKISMDGVGRALDNIYIERFWKSFKYEDLYLRDYRTVKECKKGVDRYIKMYNRKRIHQSLDYMTPDQVYKESIRKQKVERDVKIPHYSWIISYSKVNKLEFEECVEIFRKGISVDEQLRIA